VLHSQSHSSRDEVDTQVNQSRIAYCSPKACGDLSFLRWKACGPEIWSATGRANVREHYCIRFEHVPRFPSTAQGLAGIPSVCCRGYVAQICQSCQAVGNGNLPSRRECAGFQGSSDTCYVFATREFICGSERKNDGRRGGGGLGWTRRS